MPEPAARAWSHDALVLLRMDLRGSAPGPDPAVERVARVARTLVPGELLAVRLGPGASEEEVWAGAGAVDLRRVLCAFAPDDRELLIWAAPPELPPSGGPGPLDVRALAPPLPLVVTAQALARLGPGEVVVQVNDHHSPVLVDLLAGRAVVGYEGAWEQDHVTVRIVRSPPGGAAGR